MKNLEDTLARLVTAIQGDEANGLEGLVHKQRKDDEFREELKEYMRTNRDHLQRIEEHSVKNLELIMHNDQRLKKIEVVFNVISHLSAIKKKTLIVIGGIITSLIGIIQSWEQLVHIVKQATGK